MLGGRAVTSSLSSIKGKQEELVKKAVEILAPAGSFESMKAAVAAGADAVYMGGSRFGARAYAENPEEDKLLEAIDYVHLHGRKLYMTVNTLMKEQEIKELYDYLVPYYRQGLDAVIVQDMGTFRFIRENFPDLPIHASTQMTITGAYGAKILKDLGADRVVTARELSLKEIAKIRDQVDVEIESFVHGALCYCYSGQCLFSSLIGGRSGNRGRCAQTCRLPYEVKREGQALGGGSDRYCLSLKDLSTLDIIPDMIEAGVYSMKIEGRMKSPRYTAGVVSIYRKYADLYLAHGREGYRVEEQDKKMLLDLFDRGGQTDGYYKRQNGRDMVVWKEKPAFREGNQALFDYLDKNFVEKQVREPVVGTAFLEEGQVASLLLSACGHNATVTGEIVQTAQNQPVTEEKVRKQLDKTGNTPFYFETLDIKIKGNIFLPVQALNDLRRRGLEALEYEILKDYKENRQAEPVKAAKEAVYNRKAASESPKLSVSLERPDCLEEAVANPDVKRIYIDAAEFKPGQWNASVEACHRAGKECMLTMPHIFRIRAEQFFDKHLTELKAAEFDGFLIRSLEETGYLKEKNVKGSLVFDFGMYGMNNTAQEMLMELGADELTWPVELNSRDLGKLRVPGELLVYGRLPMMVTAQCLHEGMEQCDKTPVVLTLKDRMGKSFPVKNHCAFCYNSIYNSAAVSLLGLEEAVKGLSPSWLRLQFTTENKAQTKAVIQSFSDGFLYGREAKLPFEEFTRGHFKRGVE
ncbi:U32 family peptidase [Clostridium sp. WB02_MRS01]|nr:U32 family peptidase [Clostridium sp. WB02_MRS01]